jgi:undecaprenyl-diphosphatase
MRNFPANFSKFIHYKGSKDVPRSNRWELIKNRFRNKHGHGFKLIIAFISICIAVILLLIIFESLANRGTLYYLDFKFYSFVKGVVNPPGTVFMNNIIKFFNKYIIWGFPGTLIIYLLLKKEWWSIFALFLSVGGGGILIAYLKIIFYRWSPMCRIIAGRGHAFPSGHAFYAMIIFGFMIFLAREFIKSHWLKSLIYFFCTLLILLIGISLIVTNNHCFTEVLGGYCAGFSWLLISILLIKIISYPWKAEDGKGYENGGSF